MFRTIYQTLQPVLRVSVRSYCNQNKKFKTKQTASVKQEFQSTDKQAPNENNETKLNDEEQSNQSQDEYNKQESNTNKGHTDQSETERTNLMVRGSFEHISVKNRETYLNMVKLFETKDVHRRNHVEFIYAALKNMKEYGVNRDLVVYKALIDIMPKGKFIPTNLFQAEFVHYPKQQQCIIDLLDQMEDNGKIG